MKICDLQSGAGRVKRATRMLKEKGENTKEHWNDQTSCEFEEKYLRPLFPEVTMALTSVYRLNELLEQAERDCEDRGGE